MIAAHANISRREDPDTTTMIQTYKFLCFFFLLGTSAIIGSSDPEGSDTKGRDGEGGSKPVVKEA
jgi:hypothetical protein